MATGIFIPSFPGSSDSKELACNVQDPGDPGWIPELGRSRGEGNGYPLWYYCLENSMDRGAWQATVHGMAITKSQKNNNNKRVSLWGVT